LKKLTLTLFFLFLLPFITLNAKEHNAIEIDELESYMQSNIIVIDIRAENRWKRTGLIPSSYRLHFEDKKNFNKKRWEHILVRLLKEKKRAFVLISKDGQKAKKLSDELKKKKFVNALYLKGGIRAWINADRRVINY